jgi:AcrR family transcriptional regulator
MRKDKDRYQHGNLAQALLDDAMNMIASGPASEISLRDLADRAGVSPRAPYTHYASRSDLLRAMARTGFERLSQYTAKAPSDLVSLGEIYIQFALTNPHLFRLMFGGILAEDCAEDTGDSFHHLVATLERVNPELTSAETLSAGMALWCLVHGLAALRIEGMAGDVPNLEHMLTSLQKLLQR